MSANWHSRAGKGLSSLTTWNDKICAVEVVSTTKGRLVSHVQVTLWTNYDVSVCSAIFSQKLQKVPDFVQNHEKPSIWPKLATFRANYHVSVFTATLQQKLQKVPHFVKNHEKSSMRPKLETSN